MQSYKKAETEFFSQGWEHLLDELVGAAREHLILVAPFIKKHPLQRISRLLSGLPFDSQPKITILTNMNRKSLLDNTLEISSLVKFVDEVQTVCVKSLSTLHAKIYLADKSKAIVTSANLTLSGLLSSTEYGVIIRDPSMVNRVYQDVTTFLEKSELITQEKLRKICEEIVEDPCYRPKYVPIVKREVTPTAITLEVESDEDSHIPTEEKEYFDAVDDKDWVEVYKHEARRLPLLTAEKEVALAKRMECGLAAQEHLETLGETLSPDDIYALQGEIQDGEDAKEHLIWANTRLVIKIAKNYKNRGVPFLDLIQEGNIGLIRVTDKFEYQRGNRFSTYATWWIRQAVSRAVANQGRTIRVPVHIGDQLNRMQEIQDQLTQELRRAPTVDEIARGFSSDPDEHAQFVEKIKPLQEISRHPISLDKLLDDLSDGANWDIDASMDEKDHIEFAEASFSMDNQLDDNNDANDFNIDTLLDEKDEVEFAESLFNVDSIEGLPQIPSPEEEVAIRIDVQSSLETLNKREANILRMRFGLNGANQEYTLEELGERLRVSRERIRQIEKQALKRLADSSYASSLRLYVNA